MQTKWSGRKDVDLGWFSKQEEKQKLVGDKVAL